MYAAKNVRPRSSLSTDDNHRIKDTNRLHKAPSNTILTLAAFCIFLLVLCGFLLGALVYVGKNIAEEHQRQQHANASQWALNSTIRTVYVDRDQLLSTKPIISVLSDNRVHTTRVPTSRKSSIMATVEPAVKAASKVLQNLGFRLPKQIKPSKYRLHLRPDLERKNYSGNISISLQVLEPIAFIPVHVKQLNVSTVEVKRLDESGAPLKDITPTLTFAHPEFEYWVTEFEQPLEAGNYSLLLNFTGSLLDRITGMYQSSYLDKLKNRSRPLISTKFEPTYARQAFPCFDEPALKAQFTITVARPSGDEYHVLSNMPVAREFVDGDITEVTFAETVPMSTYLAAFVVSDFQYKETTVEGTSIALKVYAPPAQVEKTQYALDTAAGVTAYYINYFNVSYPLPKLDLVAIPDFVSGAMENWGLVTFRETALLYDESTSSSVNKQRVAVVVAHELAHQWFGNLVTMNWWNDLWLNEGFASFLEYKGVKQMHPEWDMDNQFVIEELHPVLTIDATLASHPIVKSIESPAEITEYFDTITYSKGAALVRMLENLVGEEKLRNATTRYLVRHIYNTATTEDYLTAVEEEEGLDFDVKQIMQTWTEQMGLPVVEVEKSGSTYKLTQKRFLANEDDYAAEAEASSFNYRWSIPITYTSSISSEVQSLIFNHNDNEATITLPGEASWIKINTNQVGFYRVNYDSNQWSELISALKNSRETFSTADRAHLLNDANTLAAAGQLSYSVALDLISYLESEQDYVPWSVGTSALATLRNRVYYTDLYTNFTTYARKLLTPIVEKVTFTVGADHLENRLRIKVLSSASSLGHESSLQQSVTLFNQWLANPESRPSPDIRDVVYYYGMQQVNTEAAWDQVWKLYLEESDAQEKLKLMNCLTAVQVPWLLQRYINWAWDESNVRRQDYFTLLGYISTNPVGQSLVWDYVRENWEKLVEHFGINERTLGRLIPTITARFSTETKLEEMQQFFAKYPEAGAGTAARQQALEAVKANIKWLAVNKAQVGEWLANYVQQSTVTNRIQ
ncbi:glutamyl aminopeptidase isoform X1 [Drosophila erecta]|uniref:glutamyl aminopeptidase isoform X1 n=1 Tax=Drosophila erecta TaxID=7220 RepID=UPI000F06ABAD|nr:glutamyl aminopeptidase isoform X1 [Drosophila erecta]XP_026835052.1 glutamyl aminopeptidase isoform X1 [Drosophila erecta]XP_026835055.1 glutamyl aminopeptidase isoform X1 [Drosophila erecta]XP_026835058.1 glutamyl aminopeptidase isoform X1 [Drosophila erecta]